MSFNHRGIVICLKYYYYNLKCLCVSLVKSFYTLPYVVKNIVSVLCPVLFVCSWNSSVKFDALERLQYEVTKSHFLYSFVSF
jgi:hypothetical protein